MPYWLKIVISLGISSVAFAQGEAPTGIGAVAQNLMGPVGMFSDFIYTGCLVIGGSFLFAGIIKYIEHKRSPLFVPISTVIFLFIAGIVLLLLPFSYLLIHHGTPYSLFRK